MQDLKKEVTRITQLPIAAECLDVASGYMFDVIYSQHDGMTQIMFGDIPLVFVSKLDDESLHMLSPKFKMFSSKLTDPLSKCIPDRELSEDELYSLSSIMVMVLSFLKSVGFQDPTELTQYNTKET